MIRQIAAKAHAVETILKVFSDFAKKLLTNFPERLLTRGLALVREFQNTQPKTKSRLHSVRSAVPL
jgi:hypothetical protein